MNHKIFQKLFFDTIHSVINPIYKQLDDVILSKYYQKSQGKDKLGHIHKNQQSDDVISTKNNQVPKNEGKDALKDLIKNNHNAVEGNNNPSDKAI